MPETAHDEWGYCYNTYRIDISYEPTKGWDPAYGLTAEYQNVSLDTLYPADRQGQYAVLTDGNGAYRNALNNFDPFNAGTWIFDWQIQPIHGNGVNTLFMDGHVQFMNLVSAQDKLAMTKAWFGGVPTATNPYRND